MFSREVKKENRPAISDDENGVVRVEGHVIELGLLPGNDGLGADGVVLVDVEVEHVDLAVHRHGCEHGAGVGRPRHVAHLGVQVEHEQRFPGGEKSIF